jgi:hypothetical protein
VLIAIVLLPIITCLCYQTLTLHSFFPSLSSFSFLSPHITVLVIVLIAIVVLLAITGVFNGSDSADDAR